MQRNNIDRLRNWRDRGVFPANHDAIARVIMGNVVGSRALDLHCGFGLLAQRVFEADMLASAYGIGEDEDAVAEAQAEDIDVILSYAPPETRATEAVDLAIRCGLDVLFARRCLPELFGNDIAQGSTFAGALRAAGVMEVFIEGRQYPEPDSALRSIDDEVAMFKGSYHEMFRSGAVSYLLAN